MGRLQCGIVGLPNVGKSTLFNALTRNNIESANYPFCTIDPNVGIVAVPDPRLEELSKISKSKKIIPAVVEFVDIAGLVAGASQGEGLGNKFLTNIRETDAIAHVVRCFEDDEVIHVAGKVDPIQDIEVVNLELILADADMLEGAVNKVIKQAKGKKELLVQATVMNKVLAHLHANQPVRNLELTQEEKDIMRLYPLLTAKRVLYVCNISEDDLAAGGNALVDQVRSYAQKEGGMVLCICARLEEELSQLPVPEAKEMLREMGMQESGLDKLVKCAYELLGLITFLTTGEMETRAWTIRRGTPAMEAAGEIHTDIQKGFIRAETVSFQDMLHYQGRQPAREAGKVRSEGKEYIVKDGDVLLFLHN